MQGDLTTLAKVTAWLAPAEGAWTPTATQTQILTDWISAASQFIMGYIGRSTLAPQTFSEYVDTGGRDFMVVRQWPVISVQQLAICGVAVQPAVVSPPALPSCGFVLEPPPEGGGQQRLQLYGGLMFPRGRGLTYISYLAGYQTSEALAPALSGGVWSATTSLTWVSDQGLARADGTPLTLVSGTPVAGQYSVSSSGVYTISAADSGQPLQVTYGYVPRDLEYACVMLVGERYRSRSRIGEKSRALPQNGGTVTYDIRDMSDMVRTTLQPYRRITPS